MNFGSNRFEGGSRWCLLHRFCALLVLLVADNLPLTTSICPPDSNYSDYIGKPCAQDNLQCSYGTEACCGRVHVSVLCDCSSGEFMCLATEACMAACEVSSGVNQTTWAPALNASSNLGSAPVVTVESKESSDIEVEGIWQIDSINVQQADELALVFAGHGLCDLLVGPAVQLMMVESWCLSAQLMSSAENMQNCVRGCINQCAMDSSCVAVDLKDGHCRKYVNHDRTAGSVWFQVDTDAKSGLCFLMMNASNTEVLSSCSQCEPSGYQDDSCNCGVCGSFGRCTYSCGSGREEMSGAMLGPRCTPQKNNISDIPRIPSQHLRSTDAQGTKSGSLQGLKPPKPGEEKLKLGEDKHAGMSWSLFAIVSSGVLLLLVVVVYVVSLKFHRRQLLAAESSIDVPLQELGGGSDVEEPQNGGLPAALSRRFQQFLSYCWVMLCNLPRARHPYVPGGFPLVTINAQFNQFDDVRS